MIKNKRCVICKFKQHNHEHHLQRFTQYGSDEDCNKVYLCPNHHWIADFGTEEDKLLLLKKIKELTGKEPVIDYDKKNYFDKLLRAQEEHRFLKNPPYEYTDKEWEEQKNFFSVDFMKEIFLCRPGHIMYYEKHEYIKKAELLYLQKLIRKALEKCQKN